MATATFGVSLLLSLQDKISAQLSKISDGVSKVGDAVNAAAVKLKDFGEKINKAGQEFGKVGKDLTMKMTLPIVALGGAAVKASLDFNKGMANIATLIPGNAKRVNDLGKEIIKLSEATGTSTEDLTDGMYQVVSAFGDSAESVNQLAAANKAAKAGLSTTTEAINLLSAVTKGYNDTSAAAVTKASDLAFVTLKLGQTTFPELASSIGKVIPMANAMKTSQEELFAVFATLTGVTGNAAEVSTQMKAVYTSLMKPSTDLSVAIRSLGYSSADAMIQQFGLVGTIQKLSATAGGSKEKLAALFGSVEGLTSILALTGSQADAFKAKFAEMQKASGATEQAFKDQTTGIGAAGFSMQKMMASIKALAISIGQQLLPFVQKVVGIFTSLLGFINSMPQGVKDLIMTIAGVAAAAGPVLVAVSAFKKLQVVIGMLKANPIFLVIGAVAALASALRGARTDTASMQKSLDDYKAANERASQNVALLQSMRMAGQGTEEYKKSLQSLIDANPKLANSNIDLKASYDQVADAVSKLNEQERIRAKNKAMEEYKAGLNTLGDLTRALTEAELEFKSASVGDEDYAEKKIKYEKAKLDFEEMVGTLRTAGKLVGHKDERVQRDIEKEAKFEVFGGSADLTSEAARTVVQKGQYSGSENPMLTQALQGVQQALQTPPPNPQLQGTIKVVVEGGGTATGGFNNGNIRTEVTSTGAAGRTRNL